MNRYNKILICSLLITSMNTAFACSCAISGRGLDVDVQYQFKSAQFVVSAHANSKQNVTVKNPDTGQIMPTGKDIVNFTVLNSWKGSLENTFETRILYSEDSCGFHFRTGQNYLIFITGVDKDGYYITSLCAGTKHITGDDPEIQILDRISQNE